MIAHAKVEQIRHLLNEGHLSQRKIARHLGVSRGTVDAIAQGRRSEDSPYRREPSDGLPSPLGPPRRCPGCGGLVQMPCLLCHIRALRRLTGPDRPSRK
jgi:hypothetical protein